MLYARIYGMKRVVAALVVLGSLWTSAASAQGPDAQRLYTQLYCPLCGGVRLDACTLRVCEEMRVEIDQKLEAGETPAQIIAYYRARWGDQVLGYPPAEGINLAAWIAPVALVALGLLLLIRMALTWTKRRPAVGQVAGPPVVSEELAARIERELNE